MKILFLIGKDVPIDAVSEWEEIKEYKDKGGFAPSKGFYSIFKALEQVPEFARQVLLARENAGIPENGISWEDYYYNYYMEDFRTYTGQEREKLNNFFSKVDKEVTRIRQKMKLDPYVSSRLNTLIIGSFVFPEDFPLTYGADPIDEGDLSLGNSNVFIHSYHKVTLHKLTKYIEDNWKSIEALMEALPPLPKYGISKRDFKIVELRDKEEIKFKDIPDKITALGLDDSEPLNEDSAKTAYKRAKEKIDSLMKHTKR